MRSLSRLPHPAGAALAFVVLMGVVSLLADMTHEGARGIYGAYLPLLGVSATGLGFVMGFGELLAYGLRLVTGIIADRTRHYWGMMLLGYAVSLIAVPCLALVSENGWQAACLLILLERIGKAVRQPAKNTLLSFAASRIGAGKAFALQECLDQIGVFLGPALLFGVLWFSQGAEPLEAFASCFAVLAAPAALCLCVLLLVRRRFPHPEGLERAGRPQVSVPNGDFILYLVAVGLFGLGFMDFPLITMHLARENVIEERFLPLLYALAMLADAVAALFWGWLYDRVKFISLLVACGVSAFCAVLLFRADSLLPTLAGVVLWGAGMGAQESVFKAAVVSLSSRDRRSVSFGAFESCLGICWFLGSWFMGWLYERDPARLTLFSVAIQLCALPLYALLQRRVVSARASR